jgi:hypothetical protein
MRTDIWIPDVDVATEEGMQDYMGELMQRGDDANICALADMADFYRHRSVSGIDLTDEIDAVILKIASRTEAPEPEQTLEEPIDISEPDESDDWQTHIQIHDMLNAASNASFLEDKDGESIKAIVSRIGKSDTLDEVISQAIKGV